MRTTPPIVFLHLFKCGGTSIIDAMGRIVGMERLYHAKNLERLRAELADPDAPVNKAAVVAGHMRSDQIAEWFAGAPVFTVLRDPVDRMISQYFHFRREGARLAEDRGPGDRTRGKPAHLFRCQFCQENSFGAFVAASDRRLTAYTRNYMTRRIAGLTGRQSRQTGGSMLQAALAILERLAFVTTTDRIDEDFPGLFKALAERQGCDTRAARFSRPVRRRRNVSHNRPGAALDLSAETLKTLIANNRDDLALHAAARWFDPGSGDS
ncbi:hypothetical protein GGD81_004403 [Rhodobium orientis]|uniref:Sulfotransferase family protein n=1 Tax=Rhodobium orientis TaxID=34017 RepID=A0A327JQ53_9HYPH|nr:sulfotransferase family 2 domain-containing protein [Rhodobium orientis]MBB4305328.1 hypothetical protein [Rhodobium orientis]MBK5949923.1 hypothetical protein [Rhodobium orientis]RAI25538.1 hypothetical protein CH339_17640 [Rhodobium orientis]